MCFGNHILRLVRESVIFGILTILVSYCISYMMTGQFVQGRETWNKNYTMEKAVFLTGSLSYLVYYFYINLLYMIRVY
jgi:hypothetical protein